MQTSLQPMYTSVKNKTQTAGHQKPYKLRSGQPSLASPQRKTKMKFWGLWLWKRLTSTIQQHPGHTSTPMAQLKMPQETGYGAYIKHPGKPPVSVSAPGGMLCSNYKAEVLVQLNATETIISWEEKPKKAVFLTDSRSALQALLSGKPDTMQKNLTKNISNLAQSTCVVLQWIPAHNGIRGNEIADQLAKEGRKKEHPYHICPTEKSKLLSMI